MKKIAVSVIKLIIINIILNLVINVVRYLLDVEINEIVAYIIYFVENLIIVFIGVKILWQKFNVETVKKILYIVTIVLVIYNIFSVMIAITQYEKNLSNINSQSNLTNYSSSTEIAEEEIIKDANEAMEQAREAEKDAYYTLLIRSNGVIYNIIIIVLYCFIAPKWFKSQKQEIQDNKYDFYKE